MVTMTRALLIVDTQNDFCEGGALGVEGGTDAAKRIAGLLAERPGLYTAVYASQDWHNPLPDLNGGHFAPEGTEPDYRDSWPVHCVGGTRGASLQRDLALALSALAQDGLTVRQIRKGQGRPDYSAFQGRNPFGQQSLAWELGEDGVTSLDICGIATDHCVKASTLDALDLEKVNQLEEVRVITDLIAGVDLIASRAALAGMKASGAVLTDTGRL
jgi:nicotinamidase/pyrazinamidase